MGVSQLTSSPRLPVRQRLWLASFVALPYAMYAALLVMIYLLVTAMVARGRSVWKLCGQWGFGWLSAGLLLSASFALNRGDAFLQLANFLPFFLLWSVLATNPKVVAQPFVVLEKLARWLVLSSVPLCAIALVEYLLKFEALIEPLKASSLPQWFLGWLYEEPYFGHRARSLFDHPNGLSAYLAIVLGLGLGLLLKVLADRESSAQAVTALTQQTMQLVGAVILCLIAIFCTGSRNGVLIALVLVAIALYIARRYRWAWLSGLMFLSAIATAVFSFGIGGRTLSFAIFTDDPRVGVWRLAIEMIRQRPLLGWGFSGLRELYVPGSVQGYEIIFHAHNILLFLASESGLPVTIGFCVIFGTILYRAVRAYLYSPDSSGEAKEINSHRFNSGASAGDKAILLSYLLAFSSCLMFGLFDVVLFDARLNVPVWGLLAALYLLSRPSSSLSR